MKEKVKNWIVLGTNISVIITAVISLLTLVQIKRQTSFSYRPDLTFSAANSTIVLEYTIDTNGLLQWAPLIDSSSQLTDKGLVLSLNNVGQGAAIDVHIESAISSRQLCGRLHLMGQKIETQSSWDAASQSYTIRGVTHIHDTGKHLDYLLPLAQSSQAEKLEYPAPHLELWLQALASILTQCPAEKHPETIKAFLEQQQSLAYTIKYRDIGRQKFRKTQYLGLLPTIINEQSRTLYLSTGMITDPDTENTLYFIPPDGVGLNLITYHINR